MPSIGIWMMATRPKTLPAAVGPVLVGSAQAFSDQGFEVWPALAALMVALLLQVGVNLANDYFDYIGGIDTSQRLGPARVTQSGLISVPEIKKALFLVFGLALIIGFYLMVVGGWVVILIGITAIIAALGYSGGPYPLASHGLGDVFVFIFFGLVAVCGTYYVQTLGISLDVFLIGAMVGLPITAIIVVNNLRDIQTDEKAGKRTLAVILGPKGSKTEYILLLLGAFGMPLIVWMTGRTSGWILLTWLSLPYGIALMRAFWRSDISAALNHELARTAGFSILYNGLLSIGLLLG